MEISKNGRINLGMEELMKERKNGYTKMEAWMNRSKHG